MRRLAALTLVGKAYGLPAVPAPLADDPFNPVVNPGHGARVLYDDGSFQTPAGSAESAPTPRRGSR